MQISYDAERRTMVMRLLIWIATSRLVRWLARWNYRVETAIIQESAGFDPVVFEDVRPWGPDRRRGFGVIRAKRPQEIPREPTSQGRAEG